MRHVFGLALALAIAGQLLVPGRAAAAEKSASGASSSVSVGDRAARLEERLIDLQVQLATLHSLAGAGASANPQVAAIDSEIGALAGEIQTLSGRPSSIMPGATAARSPVLAAAAAGLPPAGQPAGGQSPGGQYPADQGGVNQPAANQSTPGFAQPGIGRGADAQGWFGSTTVLPSPRVTDPGAGAPAGGFSAQGELLPQAVERGSIATDAPPASAPSSPPPPGHPAGGWVSSPYSQSPPASGFGQDTGNQTALVSPPAHPPGSSYENSPAIGNLQPPAVANDADTAYQTAYGYLLQQDYGAAQLAMQKFLQNHPTSELAGNAQYWIGETHYVRGAYREAAVAFLEAYEKYGNGSKGPDSLLKLALSLGQLDQKDAACSSLREIGSRYRSAPAELHGRAKAEMGRLGCRN
ncbi:MAG: tol-pal system protein YbgF [Alphaproteobacteria bacterium]|nr:tol-pal system protein YbgF [Alphaproteobacteria bacterium]